MGQDGGQHTLYLRKGKLIAIADFLRLNSSGTLVSMDTRDEGKLAPGWPVTM